MRDRGAGRPCRVKSTYVKRGQASAISVEGGIVEVSELFRDGVDVSHGARYVGRRA
jgi:hypothetical protein